MKLQQLSLIFDADPMFFSSGTAAFLGILKALLQNGIYPKVLLPAFTCEKLLLPLLYTGTPFRLVDNAVGWVTPELEDYEISYTGQETVIVVVYSFGYVPRTLTQLLCWARAKGLIVIEDICSSLGFTNHGSTLGTIGDYAFGSFGHDKPVELGEGGFAIQLNKNLPAPLLKYFDITPPTFYNELIKFGRRSIASAKVKSNFIKLQSRLLIPSRKHIGVEARFASYIKEGSFQHAMELRRINTQAALALANHNAVKVHLPNNAEGIGIRIFAEFPTFARDVLLEEFRRCHLWVGQDYRFPLSHWIDVPGEFGSARELSVRVLTFITNPRNLELSKSIELAMKLA